MKAKKKRQKYRMRKAMFMTYYNDGLLNDHIKKLSMIQARYEVLISDVMIHGHTRNSIKVKVRCYKNSRVYKLCESLGYEYKSYLDEN